MFYLWPNSEPAMAKMFRDDIIRFMHILFLKKGNLLPI